MKISDPGKTRRRITSLLIMFTFLVMSVTGALSFFRPFSIKIVGLHALMGFIFMAFIVVHILNNSRQLRGYLKSSKIWLIIAVIVGLSALFFYQPVPVKAVLGLSQNLGPALDRFEVKEDGMIYQYAPSDNYRMELTVKTGPNFDPEDPPTIAIWLENQGDYHIKTLLGPDEISAVLPYWSFKRKGWEKAKEEAQKDDEIDAVSTPTPNGSFDPADYILPADSDTSTPYKLFIEINQTGDAHGDYADQPSLVYSVEIDNLSPVTFQILDLVGYPKREDENGKEAWGLYFVDESFGSALKLVDSALLRIDREK
ncbi:DUF4405 domain-containing protein [Akkermansiaceae bacterium]|jgi:hypothetical protein|nr:DUF4405 domain-containing protein [Akkermansiaceae bacterium]MDC0306904.1 DUF4405 domain-containing protein [Akkermansiaceae bacterium]